MLHKINIEEKIVASVKISIDIEAETEKEALKKAIKMFANGEFDVGESEDAFNKCEILRDTLYVMDTWDNEDYPTVEISVEGNDKMYWDNNMWEDYDYYDE